MIEESPYVYVCEMKDCDNAGPKEKMWSLDKKTMKGRLMIVCTPCAKKLRNHQIRIFPLIATAKRERIIATSASSEVRKKLIKALVFAPSTKEENAKKEYETLLNK